MTFIPLVIYGVYQIFFEDHRNWLCLSIGFTGILQSHMITTSITAIICIIFGVICMDKLKDKKIVISLFKAIGIVILINLWFIILF